MVCEILSCSLISFVVLGGTFLVVTYSWWRFSRYLYQLLFLLSNTEIDLSAFISSHRADILYLSDKGSDLAKRRFFVIGPISGCPASYIILYSWQQFPRTPNITTCEEDRATFEILLFANFQCTLCANNTLNGTLFLDCKIACVYVIASQYGSHVLQNKILSSLLKIQTLSVCSGFGLLAWIQLNIYVDTDALCLSFYCCNDVGDTNPLDSSLACFLITSQSCQPFGVAFNSIPIPCVISPSR